MEHREVLHQLQHHRHSKPHQCCGGVLGVRPLPLTYHLIQSKTATYDHLHKIT